MCVLAPQYTNVIFMLTMTFSISRVVDEIMTKCNYILASAVLTESITQRSTYYDLLLRSIYRLNLNNISEPEYVRETHYNHLSKKMMTLE